MAKSKTQPFSRPPWERMMRFHDRLKLPMAFDAQRNGYYYNKPMDQFPQLPFSEAEIFALLVAHKALAQFCGTHFEQRFVRATAVKPFKLTLNVGDHSVTPQIPAGKNVAIRL